MVYIHNGISLSNQKNAILPFATLWMELEGLMLSGIRERQISYDFTHMRTLRHRTDEHKGRETKIIQKQGGGQSIRDS